MVVGEGMLMASDGRARHGAHLRFPTRIGLARRRLMHPAMIAQHAAQAEREDRIRPITSVGP